MPTVTLRWRGTTHEDQYPVPKVDQVEVNPIKTGIVDVVKTSVSMRGRPLRVGVKTEPVDGTLMVSLTFFLTYMSRVSLLTQENTEVDPSHESAKSVVTSKSVPVAQPRTAKPPITTKQPNASSPPRTGPISHKKGARPARRGKVGRNQYTRDRDAAADARAEAARALHSRDGEDGIVADANNLFLPNGSKPARPKHMNPNRTSMNELRKRAAGILEYISRTQVEMAGERTPSGAHTPAKGVSNSATARPSSVTGASKLSNVVHGGDDDDDDRNGADAPTQEDRLKIEADDFKKMSSLQMMDVLTREIVHWQRQHGKWGEK